MVVELVDGGFVGAVGGLVGGFVGAVSGLFGGFVGGGVGFEAQANFK
jgi:hypothetical protein